MSHKTDKATHSVVNVDDPIGKFVGKRPLRPSSRARAVGRAIYRRRGFRVCDKGVFRFASHKEADEWMMEMAIKRARRSETNPPPTPHPPDDNDLIALCLRLNELEARYVVVGGWAVIHSGYGRFTEDVDLVIDTAPENEAKVFQLLESLPDQAVKGLDPGDVDRYTVVRIADEIVVDLMKAAWGIDYAEAARETVIRELGGVPIPFASPELLWRMKVHTHRAKDAPDLEFLRHYFASRGEEPPPT